MKKHKEPKAPLRRRYRIVQLFLVTGLLLFGYAGYGQEKKFDLKLSNVTLEQAFDEIEKKTDFRFMYNQQAIDVKQRVTVDLTQKTISEMVAAVLAGKNVNYQIAGQQIVISPKQSVSQNSTQAVLPEQRNAGSQQVATSTTPTLATQVPQSQQTVSGVVTDAETGETMPFVTIVVKNTLGSIVATATTDDNGKYHIKYANRSDLLVVSFMGYEPQGLTINDQAVLNVALKPSVNVLDEVVVTGYQTISKERATGAYEILSAKEMDHKISLSATSAIEGQMAGVVVQGDNVVIRGISTLSGNIGTSPLVVIDGMPTERTLNSVNMNEVETFTVLKDAAASSIYGVRAANGVIVITTKKAQAGKTTVNLSGDWQWTPNPSLSDYHYASTSDIINYEMGYWQKRISDANKTELEYFSSEMRGLNTGSAYFSPLATLRWQRATGVLGQAQFEETVNQLRNYDYRQEYMDKAWRTPFRQNYNLSVGTASDRQNTIFSLYFNDNKARSIAEGGDNFKVAINTNQKITKWLSVDLSIDAQYAKTQTGYNKYTAFDNLEAYTRIIDDNGNRAYRSYTNILSNGIPGLNALLIDELNILRQDPATAATFSSYNFNILDELERNKTNTKGLNLRTWGRINVDIYKGLKFSSSFSYESNTQSSELLWEADGYNMRYYRNRLVSKSGTGFVQNLKDGAMLRQTKTSNYNYVLRNQLEYKGDIATDHAINAVAGIETQEKSSDLNSVRNALGYDPQTLNYWTNPNLDLLLGTGVISYIYNTSNTTIVDMYDPGRMSNPLHRYIGMYAAAGYSYKNLYNFSGSFRIDQADLFGTDPKYRYRPLWSIGAGWNMSNEEFMKDVKWVNRLTVSASYGITGNVDQNSSPYVTAKSGNSSVNYIEHPSRSTYIDTAPNPTLRWEKTTSYGGTVDFVLFNYLLNGKIEAYYKYSDDLLTEKDTDLATGFSSASVNNGAMSNRGLEFTLNSTWFNKADWRLTSRLIASYNKNEIEQINYMPSNSNQLITNTYFLQGYPRNSLYAYRYGGLTTGGTDEQNGVPIITKADGTKLYTFNADGTLSVPNELMTPEDVVYMGSLTPLWTGSFTQQVAFKDFELSFMFTYSGGDVMRLPNYTWSASAPTTGNIPEDITKAWTPTNINSTIPKTYLYYGKSVTNVSDLMTYWQQSDVNVVPADILRLRNISLSYRLPNKYAQKIGMQNLKLTGQINNLWFWSAAGNGIDPDAQGRNNFTWTVPTAKSYLLRLELTF